MRMRTIFSATLPLIVALSAQASESLPGDETQVVSEERLQTLVHECTACHGKDGVSHEPGVPSLAGKPAEKILEAVEQFYFYERHCSDVPGYQNGVPESGARNMCDVSNRLTKQEVQAIGKHFEAIPAPE